MLNRSEFEVLYACMQGHASTQRCIAEASGLSLGSVNKAVKSLAKAGLVDAELALTDAGRVALDAYRVDSAIILAAGAGTRFAPLSFERPKALFEVRGEVLIERLIRQLRQAGIERICVVTGYMKESRNHGEPGVCNAQQPFFGLVRPPAPGQQLHHLIRSVLRRRAVLQPLLRPLLHGKPS